MVDKPKMVKIRLISLCNVCAGRILSNVLSVSADREYGTFSFWAGF